MPKTSDAIRTMHREQMLPAIFFIFSRVACDENAARLAADDALGLTSPQEQMLIQAEVDKLRWAVPPPGASLQVLKCFTNGL